jgi:hypothetical protein
MKIKPLMLILILVLVLTGQVMAQEETELIEAEKPIETSDVTEAEEEEAMVQIGDLSFDFGAYLDLLTLSSDLTTDAEFGMGLYLLSLSFSGEYEMVSWEAVYNFTQPGFAFTSYPTWHWLEVGYINFIILDMDSFGMDIAAGKFYNPISLDGDGTWYYTVPYYMGIMLDPDYGFKLGIDMGFDPISISLDAAYIIMEDNTSGAFNAGLPDTDPEAIGTEKNVLAAKLNVGLDLDMFSAHVGYGIKTGKFIPTGIDYGIWFLTHVIDLTAGLTLDPVSINLLGEVIIYDNNFTDNSVALSNLNGIAFLAGLGVDFDLSMLDIGILEAANIHFDFSKVIRDYVADPFNPYYDTTIMIAGFGFTHYEYFATTFEFVSWVDGDGGFSDTNTLFLFDISASF